MAFNNNITPGSPPLLWSDINEAFRQVNENFDILAVAVGGVGGLVNFESLDTNVSPTLDNTYSLGSLGTNRWKSIFLSEYHDIPGDQANGVYIGSAQIRGVASSIELPANSTVVGVPIKEPFFNAVQVDNNLRIEANTTSAPWGETVNLNSGTAMQLVVSSAADSITFNNTGVTELTASTGISVSGSTGAITVTNTGVISLTSTTALPSGRTAGAGINIDHSSGSGIKITNTGVLDIQAGSAALTISTDTATGIVTITNAAPAGNAFRYVVVDSDFGSPIEANSANGSLNVIGGAGISLSKNTVTDALTITVNPVFDLKGSVVGDDSSILVDGVGSRIVGPIYTSLLRTSESALALGATAGVGQGINAIAIGEQAGSTGQSNRALAVGFQAGLYNQGVRGIAIGQAAANSNQGTNGIAIGETAGAGNQGSNAIAVGQNAGLTSQGNFAIALGYGAGQNSQTANSIVLNASGAVQDVAAAGFFVNPVRSTATATGPMMYNPTTKELFYNTVLEFAGSTISTNDSSGITVDVQTTFNTDVTVENDLAVLQRLTVQGSRIINISELKTVVAASTSFADFQSRIAALV